MKKIAITGSSGKVGTVLRNGLTGYHITPIDLPEVDVRDYDSLVEAVRGNDALIHLAWDTKTENSNSGRINPENSLMVFNAYKSALENNVTRVLMASSVHADNFFEWDKEELMSPYRIPEPTSPYGASKIFSETLGRYFSRKGLEVVCIRLGGVNRGNKAPSNPKERPVWLSHKDCVNLFRNCLEAENVPNNFSIVYGVSESKNRIHDYSNPFGWVPKDDADNF